VVNKTKYTNIIQDKAITEHTCWSVCRLRARQIEDEFSDADLAHHLCFLSLMQEPLLRILLTRDAETEYSNNSQSTRKLSRKS
jgi:hypothetical protein